MAFTCALNSQITDSISLVNTHILGDPPTIALCNFYIAVSQALANATHNAINNQQQSYITMQAVTTQRFSRF